ncbi:hypothetical protein DFH08DRAFT_822046 [Mycena albidolilacea]|uniref:Uncharacterized protein n=1 Tax=Mycena albidolilacea TaxID=1033008 RepID=A0AAD6Z979_9AGAR|nr:hypothetical protein DFH08DRAFT_822046 [Mycena albidolilacea]
MGSNTAGFAFFDAAADFMTHEVVEYRRVMFPPVLGDSMYVPFFSVEDVPGWMTCRAVGPARVGTVMSDHTDQIYGNPTLCLSPKIMGFTIKNGTGQVPVPLF